MNNNSILFSRFQSHGANDKFNDIYLIESDGTGEVVVSSNPANDGVFYDHTAARYSSERTQIAFLSSYNSPDFMYNVFTENLVDGSINQVTQGAHDFGDVDWSPDNSQLLVSAMDSNGLMQIHLVNLDGSGLTSLTAGQSENMAAKWSPAGDKIVFQKQPDPANRDDSQIWVMDADGNNSIQLTPEIGLASNPYWSPDGVWIVLAFAADGLGQHIQKVNVVTREVVGLTAPSLDYSDGSPVWSQSGIAFASDRDWIGTPQTSNLYIMDMDGNNVNRITTGPTLDYPTDW
jgi:Tol biopolymer transport system component